MLIHVVDETADQTIRASDEGGVIGRFDLAINVQETERGHEMNEKHIGIDITVVVDSGVQGGIDFIEQGYTFIEAARR